MQDARWTTQARRGNRDTRMQRGGMSLLIVAAAALAMALVASARAAEKTARAEARGSLDRTPTAPAAGTASMPTKEACGSSSSNTESVVRIYPTAVVTSATVTLNDIAALSGDDARLAGVWAITAAPAPGQEVVIEAGAIQQVLVRRGINASAWFFRGSMKCRVSRPAQSPAEPQNATPDRQRTPRTSRLNRNMPTTAPAEAAALAPAQPAGPAPDTLEAAIYEHVTARLANLGGRPSIQVSPALRDLLRLSRPTYEFRILDRGDRQMGLIPLEVAIYRDGKAEQMHSILIEVSLTKSVVVANGPINSGQTIRPEDVIIRERKFDRADRIGISDLKAVVGQRAVRPISKDEMLVAKDIEPVPFILRNDLVTVTARRGNVSIKGVAKAMKSVGYGETVELRNEVSKQTFMATVTGPRTAELTLSPKQETSAGAVSMAEGRK